MTGIDKLLAVTDVFYHANCPDGSAAAAICAKAFSIMCTAPEFHPLQYGTDYMNALEARPGQLFVDITPPIARWREWEGMSPIVLDHHETVREVTEGLGGAYRTNERHSGAVIAFEEVLEPAARACMPAEDADALLPRWAQFANVAMVRDTWKKDSELWHRACAQAEGLNLYGAGDVIAKVHDGEFSISELEAVGEILLGKAKRKVEFAASKATHDTALVRGNPVRIAVFNCTEKLTSDIANALIDGGANVAAGYFYTMEGTDVRLCVSVRTDKSVSARGIAEEWKGGGHDRAAGFQLEGALAMGPDRVLSAIKSSLWRLAKE